MRNLDRIAVVMITVAVLFIALVTVQQHRAISPRWVEESPGIHTLQCQDGVRHVVFQENLSAFEVPSDGWSVNVPGDLDLGYTYWWDTENGAKLAAQKGCQ